MKNTINYTAKLISVFLLILTIFFVEAKADKSGVIKIAIHNWSSQLVGATVIGELMKKVDEKVEYVLMDSQTVYQSMADGDIDIVHEIWETQFGESYNKALSGGGIEEILTHDAVTRMGWWYPEYVEKECPGLPEWKALNKCSSIFARTDSNGKGVYIGGPVEWSQHDAERIKALGMNFVVKSLSSAGSIWKELDQAVKNEKPIVVFNWSPNFIGAKYKGKFVDFPKHDPKCISDASWGINPKKLYDCDNPINGYLKLAVNDDFKKNHPKGYKLIKHMNFSNSDIDKMANYVDTGGLAIPEAAEEWLKDHKDKWFIWIK